MHGTRALVPPGARLQTHTGQARPDASSARPPDRPPALAPANQWVVTCVECAALPSSGCEWDEMELREERMGGVSAKYADVGGRWGGGGNSRNDDAPTMMIWKHAKRERIYYNKLKNIGYLGN